MSQTTLRKFYIILYPAIDLFLTEKKRGALFNRHLFLTLGLYQILVYLNMFYVAYMFSKSICGLGFHIFNKLHVLCCA